MPSNTEHRSGARKIAIVLAIALPATIFWRTGSVVNSALGVIPLLTYRWFVGIPDIDSESSVPRRHLRWVVLGGSFLGVGYLTVAHINTLTNLLATHIAVITPPISIAIVGVGGVIAGITTGRIVDWKLSRLLPKHRGLLHSPLLYIGVGLPVIYIIYQQYINSSSLPQPVQYGIVVCLLSGVFWSLVHITQDKLD